MVSAPTRSAIFHLFTHAFFKALLFLGAGSVIHAMHHEQDMRHMGGLAPKIRITWVMMLIGTLSLTGVGIPHVIGFAGFHSKDAIIEAAYAAHTSYNYVFWALVIAAFMTSFYSWRLMFMTFHGKTRAEPDTFKHAHESPWVMLAPLIVLALGAVVAGFAFKEYFIGHHYKEFWNKSILEGPNNHILHEMHEVAKNVAWVSWAPFIAMAAGLGLAWLYYIRMPWLPALQLLRGSSRSICSCSTSGTSTSFTTPSSFALHAGSDGCSGSGAMARSLTASARTVSQHVFSMSPAEWSNCRPAMSIIMLSS